MRLFETIIKLAIIWRLQDNQPPKNLHLLPKLDIKPYINLATSRSTNALANEGIIVTDLEIVYVQIPVIWDNPKLEDVKIFFKIMQSFDGQKVWVHCAKNMRVSCFIYFWQKYILRLPEEQASYPMNQIWQPTGVWQTLIEQAETQLL